MKLNVMRPPEHKFVEVEGKEARSVLREVLGQVTKGILIEEMPFTGQVRCRAKNALRMGNPVWTHSDHNGQCDRERATILTMPQKIVGIIHEDGSYEAVGDGPKENPFKEKPDGTG